MIRRVMLRRVRFVFIALVVAGAGFLSGVVYERATTESLTQTVVEEVLVDIPVVVEVEKVVEDRGYY